MMPPLEVSYPTLCRIAITGPPANSILELHVALQELEHWRTLADTLNLPPFHEVKQ